MRKMRMKRSIQGYLMAHLRAIDALIKDLLNVLCALKKFGFIAKGFFLRSRTRDSTAGVIFQKVLIRFQQTKSEIRAYYYCFLFLGKKIDFF